LPPENFFHDCRDIRQVGLVMKIWKPSLQNPVKFFLSLHLYPRMQDHG